MAELLHARGRDVNSYSLYEALVQGRREQSRLGRLPQKPRVRPHERNHEVIGHCVCVCAGHRCRAKATRWSQSSSRAVLIGSMTEALCANHHHRACCIAPTGSARRLSSAAYLANVSAEREVLWFWFVPFVNLVQQTEDALTANCAQHALPPVMLGSLGATQNLQRGWCCSRPHKAAKATQRTKGYDADNDDDPKHRCIRGRARARGLEIGLVVDEAHIALDSTTEFGSFAHWLEPKYLLMATATPKDQRLNEFLAKAGRSEFVSFNVSRRGCGSAAQQALHGAVIYQSQSSIQTITDTRSTVLRMEA